MRSTSSRTATGDPARWNGTVLNLVIAFMLLFAVATIYAQTAGFNIIRFDDGKYVSGSVYLREGLSREGIEWAFSAPFASNYFPLTLTSHMLDRELFGMAYGGHHISSVAIHALNALLLFFVLQYMTGARVPSAIVAALFAVHPLNVESVAWIAERKNVLSTSFWILSIGSYAAYARRGGALRYGGAVVMMTAGLLSKPMLVTVPLVFLLLDYWPLRRIAWGASDASGTAPQCAPRSPGFLVLEKLPLLTLSLASSWMTLYAQRSTVRASESIAWVERFANGTVAYARYLGKVVWPSNLTMHYPHPYKPEAGGMGLEVWLIVFSAALLIALTLLATRRRYLTMGWLWFVGTLVPTIGVVQVGNQALADRYAYVPAIGLFIALAWAGCEWIGRAAHAGGSNRSTVAGFAVAAVLLAFGAVAHHQTGYWRDTVSLFSHVVDVIPRNPKIRFNLANEYRDREQYETAIHHYRIALETDPRAVNVQINLANTLKSVEDLDAAIDLYRSILVRKPNNAIVHNNLGATLRQDGQKDEGLLHFRRAAELDKRLASAQLNLAGALREQGDYEGAIERYMLAIQLGKRGATTWKKLGDTLVAADRLDDAILAFGNALRADPQLESARTNLESALLEVERSGG